MQEFKVHAAMLFRRYRLQDYRLLLLGWCDKVWLYIMCWAFKKSLAIRNSLWLWVAAAKGCTPLCSGLHCRQSVHPVFSAKWQEMATSRANRKPEQEPARRKRKLATSSTSNQKPCFADACYSSCLFSNCYQLPRAVSEKQETVPFETFVWLLRLLVTWHKHCTT